MLACERIHVQEDLGHIAERDRSSVCRQVFFTVHGGQHPYDVQTHPFDIPLGNPERIECFILQVYCSNRTDKRALGERIGASLRPMKFRRLKWTKPASRKGRDSRGLPGRFTAMTAAAQRSREAENYPSPRRSSATPRRPPGAMSRFSTTGSYAGMTPYCT